jgi:hypothetical protein
MAIFGLFFISRDDKTRNRIKEANASIDTLEGDTNSECNEPKRDDNIANLKQLSY